MVTSELQDLFNIRVEQLFLLESLYRNLILSGDFIPDDLIEIEDVCSKVKEELEIIDGVLLKR